MKFQVKSRNEEYYNEVVSTLMTENKLKNRNNSKVINLKLFLQVCILITSILVILGSIMLITEFNVFALLLLFVLVLLDISFFNKYSTFKDRITLVKTIDFNQSILIDDKGITEDKGKYGKITLDWKEIEVIFINKYSIVILTKDSSEIPFFSYPIEVKEEFLKGIKKEKQEKLIKNTKK